VRREGGGAGEDMMGVKNEDYACWQFVPLANSAVLFLAPAGEFKTISCLFRALTQALHIYLSSTYVITRADRKLALSFTS